MKKLIITLALFFNIAPALADWTAKDASSTTITFVNPNTCSSVACVPIVQLSNAAGATLLGTAGSANAGVLSVQGIASGTALTISGTVTSNAGTNLNTSLLALETGGNLASVKTNTDNLSLAIASTTSGQKGNLIFGAVTTAAPTYTTAQSNPLSLTTAGLLRVDGTGGTFPISGALTANQSVNTAQVNGVTTLTGTGAVGTGAQRVAVGTDTATIAGSAPGTAGTASTNVVTVQGIASMTKLLVTPDSVALPANQSVNEAQINGVTPLMGNGVTGTGSQRVTVASDNTAFAVNPLSATAPVSTMNSASAASGVNAANAFVFDDVAPTAITENNFGFARMSTNRNQYHTLRDAAGNERGQNVNANNAAGVFVDQTTLGTTNGVGIASVAATATVAPVVTMNSASGSGSLPSAMAGVFDDVAPTAITENNFGFLRMSTNRNAYTTIRDSAGNERGVTVNANNALNTTIDQTTIGTTNGVAVVASAINGASTTGNIAANNTTAVVIKASAGTLYGVQLYGIGSAPAYLKIYNATSATCGSGTPVKRLMIPAASTAANGGGSNITFGPAGVAFGTGITYCITTGITDVDTTAPAASTFLVNVDFK